MKIALVAASYSPGVGGLARHVDRLARGLAERGADVEVLAPRWLHRAERPVGWDGVLVHRFSEEIEPLRFTTATPLWNALRFAVDSRDVVHVHIDKVPLSLTVARARFHRMVLTPHAPLHSLSAWPYSRAVRTLVASSDRILCLSAAERAVLGKMVPPATGRIDVLPAGVDATAIAATPPYGSPGKVLVAVGALERHRRVDRVIAAIASLDPSFRLRILGDGPDRYRLEGYAADLQVRPRVDIAGPVSDAVLYRWLRTARVMVALAQQESSGVHILEAVAAGVPVVASDIPVHREVAEQIGEGRVIFVPPAGSPLEVADAIAEASHIAGLGDAPASSASMPSWDDVVDQAWSVYRRLTPPASAFARTMERDGVVSRSEQADTRAQGGRA
jgi:glycosyltransferase involved in cell wall biosynthesis